MLRCGVQTISGPSRIHPCGYSNRIKLTKMINHISLTPWRPMHPWTFGSFVHSRIEEQDVQFISLEVIKSLLGKRLNRSQVCKVQRQDKDAMRRCIVLHFFKSCTSGL